MKTVATYPDTGIPDCSENLDVTAVFSVNASGTTAASAARIVVPNCTESVVTCVYVDASNRCAYFYPQDNLFGSTVTIQLGTTVELYAVGGPITVFAAGTGSSATFANGQSSVVVTGGAKFRWIRGATNYCWAYMLGS